LLPGKFGCAPLLAQVGIIVMCTGARL
jgi:hypothetical protein